MADNWNKYVNSRMKGDIGHVPPMQVPGHEHAGNTTPLSSTRLNPPELIPLPDGNCAHIESPPFLEADAASKQPVPLSTTHAPSLHEAEAMLDGHVNRNLSGRHAPSEMRVVATEFAKTGSLFLGGILTAHGIGNMVQAATRRDESSEHRWKQAAKGAAQAAVGAAGVYWGLVRSRSGGMAV